MLNNKKEKFSSTPEDLKVEIIRLKGEIINLKKQNFDFEKRILNLEKHAEISNTGETSTKPSTWAQLFKNDDNKEGRETNTNKEYLQAMETIISQKWLVKITLLIENSFKKDFIALIDSGAELW